ncbi:hypothetical protein N7488_012066 [Penicillium malachiteum]|nr:hypothetical protein N7488_012066 [Penicillium malachiteum]
MESGWGVEEQTFTLGSTIHTSAVSFDEKLAAISTECEIHVWNLTTGKLEHVMSLRSSGNFKHYLKFSRAGTELYALLGPSSGKVKGDWILKGWSLVTGNALTRFTDEESSLLSLGDLSSWNLEHDHCLSQKGDFSSRPINASEWAKLRLAISPDWSMIALFHGKCAHIANPQTRCIIRTLMFPTEESDIDTIAISATKVAIGFEWIRGSMHQLIKFYDIENDTEQDLQLGKGFIVCWALSYDGSRLVSFMSSPHFEMWDLCSNQLMYSIDFGMTFIGSWSTLALLPQSNKFLTGYGGSARLWDLEQPHFPLKDSFTWTLSLNIDGTKILIQGWGLDQLETLQILNLVKGGFIPLPKHKGYLRFDSSHGLVLHQEHSHEVDKNEDGVSPGKKQGVWIWSLKAEKSHLTKGTFVPTSLEMESFAVAVSPSGTRVAIISQYGEHDHQNNPIKYWELLIEIWELHEGGVQCHLKKTVKYVTKLRNEKPNGDGRR